ncbi:uncharacterized protein SAPINGB_P005834 [Magnusiomyces paraingens]|uniref:RING-type E3 ubiquitin transferase (cysteine targeting) n=1 Tax=Magnusiomyces paraingens TaxID=2606893 RepID=A0A5E8C8U4_9ASCO|nr:uncharacterized protein SAPINGB_P005834 [Saprochaete ingens]VVT57716.1 unnamed protein product [Saprochaete ingens]
MFSRNVPTPRVGQLDASLLDAELYDILKTQLLSIFKTFKPGFKDRYEPEMLLILKLLIFKLTVWDNSATYGAKLQNLMFVDGRKCTSIKKPLSQSQRLGYAILVVGGDYIWNKIESKIAALSYESHEYNDDEDEDERPQRRLFGRHFTVARLERLSNTLSTLWSVSSLVNFVLFLYSGRYSTLILRLLRIRLVSSSPRALTRQVSFEFQNRQLVWNALTEFLLFTLPLINLGRLRRRFGKAVAYVVGGSSSGSNDGSSSNQKGELYFLPEKTCAICYKDAERAITATAMSSAGGGDSGGDGSGVNTDITNPYECVECGHVFCYVCLASRLVEAEGDGWTCLRCGELVQRMRVFGDVDVSAIKVNPAVLKEEEVVVEAEKVEQDEEDEEDEEDEGFKDNQNVDDSEGDEEDEEEDNQEDDGEDEDEDEEDEEDEDEDEFSQEDDSQYESDFSETESLSE